MRKSIIVVPNPILRAKSTPVDLKKDLKLLTKLIADLEETLEKKERPKGVGLSSPQIGKNLRVFSTLLPSSANEDGQGRPSDAEKDLAKLATYINPEIVETSKERTFGPNPEDPILEGCLSIPKLYGPVPRFTWVKLRYTTPQQEVLENTYYGFFARVIQHEYDHLDGILFTDYVKKYALPFYEMRGTKMNEIDRSIIDALG